MPTFTDLPQATGWADWHVNRFRVAFRLPQGSKPRTCADLANQFMRGFPTYVNSPAATVAFIKQGSEDLYKFHGALPIIGMAMPHYDWVRVIWKQAGSGFTVQTLHRDSPDTDDGQMAGIGAGAGGIIAGGMGAAVPPLEPLATTAGATIGGVAAYEVNRFHIMAGRRSWLLRPASPLTGPHDPTLPATDFLLETAAVERISIPPFVPMTPVIENALPAVWQNLLANFVVRSSLEQVKYGPEPGWTITPITGIDVHWYALNFRAEADMYKSPYAVDVLKDFNSILDTSQRPTHELSLLLYKIEQAARRIF